MNRVIVAIRDNALEAFGDPVTVPATGVAIRSFYDEMNNKQGEMHKHPEDYDLYQIGEYDTQTGALLSIQPLRIARGWDIVKEESNV